MPFRVDQVMPGMTFVTKLLDVRHNEDIDDTLFAKPERSRLGPYGGNGRVAPQENAALQALKRMPLPFQGIPFREPLPVTRQLQLYCRGGTDE
jgi:hypothetical protein